VFLAVLIVALVLFVVFGRPQWFFHDEWDFLAHRDARDLNDLFRPFNEHWSTLPILVYRMLWRFFGIRTYVPYQVIAIVLHLTTAVLLCVVMRRAKVNPWIATAAASLFALYGAGDRVILAAFNMTWSATLVLGLTHLILADHDGPLDRRDGLGLFAGLLGLLCSGVAITMILVVGLSALIRRGWRAAAFHIVPLGLLYLVWWFAFGRGSYSKTLGSPWDVLRFVWIALSTAFREMGQVRGVGLALGIMLIAGLVLAWHAVAWNDLRRRAAAPAALLVGAVVFLAVAGLGRVAEFGAEYARQPRYLWVAAAMCLPAIAVAADAFLRRWRAVGVVAAALLVVGIPGNVDLFVHYETQYGPAPLGQEDLILALPQVPFADEVPRGLHPMPELGDAGSLTIGWLLDGVRAGKIPVPGYVDPRTAAEANLRLSLLQSQRATEQGRCKNLVHAVTRVLKQGQAIRFNGPGQLRVSAPKHPQAAVVYTAAEGRTLTAIHGPLAVRMASNNPWPYLATLCERPKGATVPDAPRLSGNAGNDLVSLTWTTPANGGATITGYTVIRDLYKPSQVSTAVGNVNSYSDRAVANGRRYTYTVVATNVVGESPGSNVLALTPT
jgi:hypothetical protein